MNTLPINPNKITEEVIKPALRTQYSGGYIQTRPKYTRKTKKFDLEYQALSVDDKNTLATFFDENQGLSFYFNEPISSIQYTVSFVDDSIKFKNLSNKLYSSTFSIEEL